MSQQLMSHLYELNQIMESESTDTSSWAEAENRIIRSLKKDKKMRRLAKRGNLSAILYIRKISRPLPTGRTKNVTKAQH